MAKTGIIDHNIDAPVFRCHLLHGRKDLFTEGHINFHSQGISPFCFNKVYRFLCCIFVKVQTSDSESIFSQTTCNGTPDSLLGTSNNGDFFL